MSDNFTLSCCSTVDVPYQYLESRRIPVLFYTYVVEDVTYVDDMGRDPQALPRFYEMLAAGKLPQTSQINVAEYVEFFDGLLKQGGDVLHLGFTSGQSGSIHNAFLAAERLREKYPRQKLLVADPLCSSSGYGLLVDTVADMRDAGATIDEAYQWAMDNRNKVHHQFFSTDMTQFRRTGRVSGAAAAIATVLNICHQGLRQGAGQAQGHRGHGERHGAARPGRHGVRPAVLDLPLPVSRSGAAAGRRAG